MQKIDRVKFFDCYKASFGSLSQSQVDNINFLLDKFDESEIIMRLSEYAYILATIKHECAETYAPITEMGSQHYLQSKSYYPFIGRGYVQLTWRNNYQRFKEILGIDLINNPDLAKDPETAWKILEIGMSKGLFTGVKLSNYFTDTKTDFKNARRIINGTDRAELIAGYAEKFFNGLELIEEDEASEAKPEE